MTTANMPFWDTAKPGQECRVPCWPNDEAGDAVDCGAYVKGVMQKNGMFKPYGGIKNHPEGINPNVYIYLCIEHSGENFGVFEQIA